MTTIERGKPCEDRIDTGLKETERHFADLSSQIDAASHDDMEQYAELCEQLDPLSIDVVRTLRLMFSWGGPSDWIDAELRRPDRHQFEVTSVTYHYADWFDHAERVVMESEAPALWRLAEYFAETPDAYDRQPG